MNSLLILQSECISDSRAVIKDKRAEYACLTHGVEVGQTLRVAVLGGRRGSATVVGVSLTCVELELSLVDGPLERAPIDLIVGLSRPQTVKKVIQAAVMLGVRGLRFVLSERGEKSYRHSHALQEEHLQFEVIKALEQIWDSGAPTVHVDWSLHRLFAQSSWISGDSEHEIRLLAHPSGSALTGDTYGSIKNRPVVLAIGPEAGWSDAEVEMFQGQRFHSVSLGSRVLRVELALVFALGQLDILSRS